MKSNFSIFMSLFSLSFFSLTSAVMAEAKSSKPCKLAIDDSYLEYLIGYGDGERRSDKPHSNFTIDRALYKKGWKLSNDVSAADAVVVKKDFINHSLEENIFGARSKAVIKVDLVVGNDSVELSSTKYFIPTLLSGPWSGEIVPSAIKAGRSMLKKIKYALPDCK